MTARELIEQEMTADEKKFGRTLLAPAERVIDRLQRRVEELEQQRAPAPGEARLPGVR